MAEVVAGSGGGTKPATFVFDLDGVLYLGRHRIPGAEQAMSELTAAGHSLVFATNNSTKSVATVGRHIEERTGYTPALGAIATSGEATARYLEGRVSRAFVLGGAALAEMLEDRGIAVTTEWVDAEAVVVGLDRDLSYERLAGAVLAVRNGALFVATGRDATYPTREGLYPGTGSIVAAIETATSVVPIVCGKPHAPIRALVRERIEEGPVWMVGDRPETDLAMGIAEGWGTILVLTGVTDDPDAVPAEFRPDLVVDSVADLRDGLP